MTSPHTPSAPYFIVSARVGLDTSDKLERYMHFLNEREPGLNAKLSTVVRMLIARGLEQVEKEYGELPSLPKKKK